MTKNILSEVHSNQLTLEYIFKVVYDVATLHVAMHVYNHTRYHITLISIKVSKCDGKSVDFFKCNYLKKNSLSLFCIIASMVSVKKAYIESILINFHGIKQAQFILYMRI